jgi:hypothetical protein
MEPTERVDLYARLDDIRMTDSERALAIECLRRAELYCNVLERGITLLHGTGLALAALLSSRKPRGRDSNAAGY